VKVPRRLPRSQVSLTTVFTICFGVLVSVAVVLFVTHSLVALTITAGALMIAVALDHLVALLVERKVKRGWAIVIVTVAALALLAGAVLLLVPPVVSQTRQLITHWPSIRKRIFEAGPVHELWKKYRNEGRLEDLVQHLPDVVTDTAGTVLNVLGGVLNAIAAAVTIFFLSIFMLIFGGPAVDALLGEATPERRDRYRKVVHKIYDLIGGYLGGLFLICSINATLTSTMLAITGIPFFLPLGLASGFSSLVPYAGPLVMAVLVTGLSMITASVWKGVAVAIYFIVYGQVEGNILGPLVFRRTVHVNPLVVLLSIVFFSEIAGIIGAILAVPVTAAIQIVLRELLRIRRERLDLARTALNSPGETLSGIPKNDT
jgi:predicted PurR-regulated permease PerM